MVQANYLQTSFASGEWSATMQGSMDRPDYRQAMATCFNGVILESEKWTRRPGFTVGGYTRGGAAAKLLPFLFQEASPYQMEFTAGFLRFWSGLSRVTANDDQSVSSIASDPATVTTALSHGWSTGDRVFFDDLGTPDGFLLGRVFIMTSTGSATLTLVDELSGTALNASDVSFTTGTIKRIKEIATAYPGVSWANLRAVQAERQSVLLAPGIAPQVLSLTADPGDTAFGLFSIDAVNFKDGPYLDPVPGTLATPSATKGNITLTFSFQAYDSGFSYSKGDYVSNGGVNYKSLQNANLGNTPASSASYWSIVSGGDPVGSSGFAADSIGRHVRLFSEPAAWASGTTYAKNDSVKFNNVYWLSLAASNTGNQPGQDATKWAVVAGQQYAQWSWGRITAVSGSGVISGATGSNIGDMTNGSGLAGAFDGTTSKSSSASSRSSAASNPFVGYIGKNYTGAGGKAIAQATVYPSTDYGFSAPTTLTVTSVTVNLRAKASVPLSRSDGTILATTGSIANTTSPVVLVSSDQSTVWNYVWIEIVGVTSDPFGATGGAIAQIVFFGPSVNNGSVVTLQVAGPALLNTNASVWRAGVFYGAQQPKCGTYHEGRLWLGGCIANRFDASRSNDIFNMAPTEPDGTVTASNGISYLFNSPDVNAIFWMVARQEGIICGTQAGEWLIQASAANAPLTPFSIQAHRYTHIKCANIEPAVCEHTIAFVQKHKRRLMEYFADVFSGKFAAPNLTYKASHATRLGIAEVRFQQDSMPVIWGRIADNSLFGVSYKRDSLISKDGPTISAYHRHEHGDSLRTFVSLSVGPSGDAGELETLAAVTYDTTYYRVEFLGQTFNEDDDLSDANYLDGAILATAYAATITELTIYGLWALNGVEVSVSCGGLDAGDFTVEDGAITVPWGTGLGLTSADLLTYAFVSAFSGAMPIYVGYKYTSQGQLLEPNTPQESGARLGPAFGKKKRAHRVAAKLVTVLSRAVAFGTTFGKLHPAILRPKNRAEYDQATLVTGIYKETLNDSDGTGLQSRLCWEATGVGPVTIAACGVMQDTEDE